MIYSVHSRVDGPQCSFRLLSVISYLTSLNIFVYPAKCSYCWCSSWYGGYLSVCPCFDTHTHTHSERPLFPCSHHGPLASLHAGSRVHSMKPHGFTSPQPIHQAEAIPVLHLARLGICWFLRASAAFSIHPSCRQLQAGLLSGRAHGVRSMIETDGGIDRKRVSSAKSRVLSLILPRYCEIALLHPQETTPIAGGPTRLEVKWAKATRRGERTVPEQSCSTVNTDPDFEQDLLYLSPAGD